MSGAGSVSERIVVVKLKVCREWLTFVQVYAPMNDSRSEVEHFYSELQKVIEKVGKKGTLTVMGDLNARVGNRDCETQRSVIGRHGL